MNMYNQLQKKISLSKHNLRYLKDFEEMAENYAKTSIQALPYSTFRLYSETGSRVEYEAGYIEHRKRLDVFWAMVLTGHEEYLRNLEDVICAICEEYTWALPAHIHEDYTVEQTITRIDLFASETAFAISEILYLCEDLLCAGVKARMKHELIRRIVTPFKSSYMQWPLNNWSAVCIGGVINTLVYLGLDRDFAEVKPRILQSMEDFLGSYEEDGCCKEGALYWSYGFGNFVYAANLLREYTDGAINYFANPKVKKIAEFGFMLYSSENRTIPYSDGPHYFNFNIGLYHFLKKEYPEFPLPDENFEAKFGDEQRYRYADFARNLFWYDETLKSDAVNNNSIDYPNSQWYIRNTTAYGFSCKGGHNDEPHNHNDLGSFYIIKNNKFVLDDLGWAEYDRNYFDVSYRYSKCICTMSKGHSLPILNEQGQVYGKEHSAKVIESGEHLIKLDLSAAYDIDGLHLLRSFELSDNKIRITDEISGCDKITERFITRIKPAIKDGKVHIADSVLCAESKATPTVSSSTFIPRLVSCIGMKPKETVYKIDFSYNTCGKYSFTIEL